jgi:hypothetical protein
MRHMDEDHELRDSHSAAWLIDHFFDTINILGGIQGLFLIGIGAALFHSYVVYAIRVGREKRLKKHG